MAFKYKIHEFRPNEVIDPIKITENMRTLTNEINGNLDRDNLPEGGIVTDMIKNNATSIIHDEKDTTATPISRSSITFEPLLSKTYTMQHDGVVFVHFGINFVWTNIQGEFEDVTNGGQFNFDNENVSNDTTKLIELIADEGIIPGHDYFMIGNHIIEFQIVVDGIIISQSGKYERARTHNSAYITGCIPVSAGSTQVEVRKRIRRENLGNESKPIEAVKAFACTATHQQLLTYMKWR
ncbi:MAG: hypothetical protein CMC15_17870 [Flavobacteriaceae bacterium]|nr:hypothetical protein [Flavobacteriaceae bacterium]|tara:strand:- start:260 stop:973 length:714 start_codon:yes stop_codon:yes gene_type:complete